MSGRIAYWTAVLMAGLAAAAMHLICGVHLSFWEGVGSTIYILIYGDLRVWSAKSKEAAK